MNLKGPPGIDLGNANDLPRTIGQALRTLQEKKLRYVMTQCYPQYGTKTDGSPLGCNAEVLSVRMVDTKDHSIVNLLISVRLFENALTGEMIANHIECAFTYGATCQEQLNTKR